MKRVLYAVIGACALVGPAAAADLTAPVYKAPPAPVADPWNWAGGYIGANAGYSWGRSDTNVGYFTAPGGVAIVPPAGSIGSASASMDGGVLGLQAGYNLQSGMWVGGIEGDIQWTGQEGTSNYLCAASLAGGVCLPGSTFLPAGATGSALSLDQKLEWFGTFRARLGVTPSPTWLVYVTGGLAFGDIKTGATLSGFTPGGVAAVAALNSSTTKTGWTVGVGAEARISGRWTAKVEYLYMDLGTVSGSVVDTPAGIMGNYSSHITDNILRVGLNYHF
jgi:outer membrane immunogenic protein